MKVVFYHSPKERCQEFTAHFMKGVRAHGDTIENRSINGDLANSQDCAVILGVKKQRLFEQLIRRGTPMVYIDKGYTREWTHRRIAIGATQPTDYLGTWGKPPDRKAKFGWWMDPWRKRGNHILLAWSSPGYHLHGGFPPPETYASQVVETLRHYTDRPIIYRPKPNQKKVHVAGTELSMDGSSVEHDLADAWALITVGSSVCLQACMMGVPSFVLGDAIGKSLGNTDLSKIESPYLSNDRIRWLNDLGYCQWSLDEYASGEAWQCVRPEVEGLCLTNNLTGGSDGRPIKRHG